MEPRLAMNKRISNLVASAGYGKGWLSERIYNLMGITGGLRRCTYEQMQSIYNTIKNDLRKENKING